MNQGNKTALDPSARAGQYNAIRVIAKQLLSNVRTIALVEVKACTSSGGVAIAGTVDVQPLVNQVDGYGNAVPHGIIRGLTYFRMQGGSNAIIMDPAVGDIGFAAFADRDSSRVITTKKAANPATNRQFSMADGIYLGGLLNAVPQQYVEFSGNGIAVVSPTVVTIKAPAVNVENAGSALANLLNSTLLTWLNSHVHGNGNGGANTTGPTTTPASSVQTTVLKAE